MSVPKRPGAKIRADRGKAGRAVEQSAARQTRLATDRQHTCERRAVEQSEAKQARIERLCERNIKLKMLGFAQWNNVTPSL